MKLPSTPPDNRTYRILLAEDDTAIARLVEMHLKRSGFEVQIAGDGARALALFQQSNPHLVLADIQMPGLSGHELTQQIRALGSHVPILLMTAVGTEAAEIEGFKTGADDYIQKPFNPKLLLARVVANLRRVYRYDVSSGAANSAAAAPIFKFDSDADAISAAAQRTEAALSALRSGNTGGKAGSKEIPQDWSECSSCGYVGPDYKFEGRDPNGQQVFLCPNCKSQSLSFSLG